MQQIAVVGAVVPTQVLPGGRQQGVEVAAVVPPPGTYAVADEGKPWSREQVPTSSTSGKTGYPFRGAPCTCYYNTWMRTIKTVPQAQAGAKLG